MSIWMERSIYDSNQVNNKILDAHFVRKLIFNLNILFKYSIM